MTQYSTPWDGTSIGDAGPYSAADWQQIWKLLFHGERADSGVLIDSGGVGAFGLQVTQSTPTGTSIDVLPGAALVQGAWYYSDDTETLAIAANASGNPRIDTIILRADYPAQTVRVAVLQGTPAASPTPPALTQVAGVMWEIPLADIAVANGFISILDANITPRANWVNAADGVYLVDIINNSGITLETGDVVIWDSSADRAVTTTTTRNNRLVAGVWVGRTANGGAGRLQKSGIGLVNASAALTRGNRIGTSSTATAAVNEPFVGFLGRALETTSGAGLALVDIDIQPDYKPIAVLADQKAQNTAGGGSTALAWTTHDLNTEISDPDGIVTVAANQFTPIAGVYRISAIQAFVAGAAATSARIRIFNVTAAAEVCRSIIGRMTANQGGEPILDYGLFTANGTDAYALQYYILNARATDGLGIAMNVAGETEQYAQITLTKVG